MCLSTDSAVDLSELDPDPLIQFDAWKAMFSPNEDAACLATASADGAPNARMVLVKGRATDGFVFYTNRNSAKGRELASNPRATLVFHWDPRSVRVSGAVEPVAGAEADAYWEGRPRQSQLGAWASDQSSVIADRSALEQRFADVAARFDDGVFVPRPPFWGGFRVVASSIEFWQHRDDRLHDRIRYRREAGAWVRERLSP